MQIAPAELLRCRAPASRTRRVLLLVRHHAQLTQIIAQAASDPALAERTWVLLIEAPDGGWGLKGRDCSGRTRVEQDSEISRRSPPATRHPDWGEMPHQQGVRGSRPPLPQPVGLPRRGLEGLPPLGSRSARLCIAAAVRRGRGRSVPDLTQPMWGAADGPWSGIARVPGPGAAHAAPREPMRVLAALARRSWPVSRAIPAAPERFPPSRGTL
jgi:hypothetical protein